MVPALGRATVGMGGTPVRGAAPAPSAITRPIPDWADVHRELRRKGVIQALLWTEYRTGCPDGFGYTWFTERYRAYAGRLDVVLRQDHQARREVASSTSPGPRSRSPARSPARSR